MREGSLVAIVVLSSLLFGAVEEWSMGIVGILTSVTFIFFITKLRDFGNEDFAPGGIIFFALLLFSYPLFQMIPLPLSLLGAIHGNLKEIVTISPGVTPGFHSISVYPFATEMELSRLFIYLMVFFMAAFGLRDDHGLYTVIKALIVFGFILGLFGIIQHATWNGKLYWFRELTHGGSPFGPFVNKNHFAAFIGMIIPLSFGVALSTRSLEKKVLYLFFGVVMAIALFFSLSRGGIISFFAGILVFSSLIFARGASKRKLIPVFLFVSVLALYLLFLGISPIVGRFTSSEVSQYDRLIAWKGTLAAFKHFSVFGSGFGTFQYIFKIYQPEGLYLIWDHAHNDYLELLLELGIAGSIVVVLFLFSVARTIMRIEWAGRKTYTAAALLSSLTTIAVHSIVDFNLHIPSNAILFFLVLGLAVSMSKGAMSMSEGKE